MPQTPHVERHFTGSKTVRDIVIGMSDGLTVPFALAAGLSAAVNATSIIVTAGLAEIAAGAIAMGLGGYLAARSDAEHYHTERAREAREVRDNAAVEAEEVADVSRAYGLTAEEIQPVVEALRKRPEAWVDFMMRFELGLERPNGPACRIERRRDHRVRRFDRVRLLSRHRARPVAQGRAVQGYVPTGAAHDDRVLEAIFPSTFVMGSQNRADVKRAGSGRPPVGRCTRS
jgi:VIT family